MQPKDDYRDLTDEELEEPATARRGSIEVEQLEIDSDDSEFTDSFGQDDDTSDASIGQEEAARGIAGSTVRDDASRGLAGSLGRTGVAAEDAQERQPSVMREQGQIVKDNAGVFDDIKQSWKDNGEVLKEMKREITGHLNPGDEGAQGYDDDTADARERQHQS
jgi:hypothetical protein